MKKTALALALAAATSLSSGALASEFSKAELIDQAVELYPAMTGYGFIDGKYKGSPSQYNPTSLTNAQKQWLYVFRNDDKSGVLGNLFYIRVGNKYEAIPLREATKQGSEHAARKFIEDWAQSVVVEANIGSSLEEAEVDLADARKAITDAVLAGEGQVGPTELEIAQARVSALETRIALLNAMLELDQEEHAAYIEELTLAASEAHGAYLEAVSAYVADQMEQARDFQGRNIAEDLNGVNGLVASYDEETNTLSVTAAPGQVNVNGTNVGEVQSNGVVNYTMTLADNGKVTLNGIGFDFTNSYNKGEADTYAGIYAGLKSMIEGDAAWNAAVTGTDGFEWLDEVTSVDQVQQLVALAAIASVQVAADNLTGVSSTDLGVLSFDSGYGNVTDVATALTNGGSLSVTLNGVTHTVSFSNSYDAGQKSRYDDVVTEIVDSVSGTDELRVAFGVSENAVVNATDGADSWDDITEDDIVAYVEANQSFDEVLEAYYDLTYDAGVDSVTVDDQTVNVKWWDVGDATVTRVASNGSQFEITVDLSSIRSRMGDQIAHSGLSFEGVRDVWDEYWASGDPAYVTTPDDVVEGATSWDDVTLTQYVEYIENNASYGDIAYIINEVNYQRGRNAGVNAVVEETASYIKTQVDDGEITLEEVAQTIFGYQDDDYDTIDSSASSWDDVTIDEFLTHVQGNYNHTQMVWLMSEVQYAVGYDAGEAARETSLRNNLSTTYANNAANARAIATILGVDPSTDAFGNADSITDLSASEIRSGINATYTYAQLLNAVTQHRYNVGFAAGEASVALADLLEETETGGERVVDFGTSLTSVTGIVASPELVTGGTIGLTAAGIAAGYSEVQNADGTVTVFGPGASGGRTGTPEEVISAIGNAGWGDNSYWNPVNAVFSDTHVTLGFADGYGELTYANVLEAGEKVINTTSVVTGITTSAAVETASALVVDTPAQWHIVSTGNGTYRVTSQYTGNVYTGTPSQIYAAANATEQGDISTYTDQVLSSTHVTVGFQDGYGLFSNAAVESGIVWNTTTEQFEVDYKWAGHTGVDGNGLTYSTNDSTSRYGQAYNSTDQNFTNSSGWSIDVIGRNYINSGSCSGSGCGHIAGEVDDDTIAFGNIHADIVGATYDAEDLATAINNAIDVAYDGGYEEGFKDGYNAGYADGFADGRATN